MAYKVGDEAFLKVNIVRTSNEYKDGRNIRVETPNEEYIWVSEDDIDWGNEDAEEQGLLLRLPKEIQDIDKRMLEYAFVKAINLVKYGVDVDSKLESAVETSYALHNAYMKGTKDAVDRVYESKTEIRNKAIDKFAEELYNKSTNFKNIESDDYGMLHYEDIYETAEQMKGK